MAFLFTRASVVPGKIELLAGWLPGRPWAGATAGLAKVGSYRLDDPAGEVGIEGLLVRAGDGPLLHVPLTYRGTPLDGADAHLVGTTEHSALGTRWVYDGCADPVFASAVVRAMLTGGRQAALEWEDEEGVRHERQPTTTVTGSGDPGTEVPQIGAVTCADQEDSTLVHTGHLDLVVVRRVGTPVTADETLNGRWPDGDGVLAGVRARG